MAGVVAYAPRDSAIFRIKATNDTRIRSGGATVWAATVWETQTDVTAAQRNGKEVGELVGVQPKAGTPRAAPESAADTWTTIRPWSATPMSIKC